MKKILKAFFIFIFIVALSKEILVFSEEVILLIAGFTMFNFFLHVGWSALSDVLISRTNEIYFVFYDLFDLKLKNLSLYKDLQAKKLELKLAVINYYKIFKLNLIFLNLIHLISILSYFIFYLFLLLEIILIEEFNFLKIFLNKKLIALNNFKNVQTLNKKFLLNFIKFASIFSFEIKNKFLTTPLEMYLYIYIYQFLNPNLNLKINNLYINSLLKFFQTSNVSYYLNNNVYLDFKLKLYTDLNLKSKYLNVNEINSQI